MSGTLRKLEKPLKKPTGQTDGRISTKLNEANYSGNWVILSANTRTNSPVWRASTTVSCCVKCVGKWLACQTTYIITRGWQTKSKVHKSRQMTLQSSTTHNENHWESSQQSLLGTHH